MEDKLTLQHFKDKVAWEHSNYAFNKDMVWNELYELLLEKGEAVTMIILLEAAAELYATYCAGEAWEEGAELGAQYIYDQDRDMIMKQPINPYKNNNENS